MNTKSDREEQLVLELLDVVGQRSNVSQRHLANHMGVALGLANSYLKRCIRKGYIKITQVPANRYLYYLTPKGMTEKGRLTVKYLRYSLEFYRRAGESCVRVFDQCETRKLRRILLGGCSDLAEIASLRAQEHRVEIVGVYDARAGQQRLVGKPVWKDRKDCAPFDICVLTDLDAPATTYKHLQDVIGRERVLVPDILAVK
jgi:DNA-binding MarR family transcriptional regulator